MPEELVDDTRFTRSISADEKEKGSMKMPRQNLNPYGQSFVQTDYEQSTPLEVIVETPTPQNMYCIKCKRLIFERVLSYKTLKNKTRAVVAVHHVCGTLMYKFVKKEGE